MISVKAQLTSEFLKAQAQTYWSPSENGYCESNLDFGGLSLRLTAKVSRKYNRQVDKNLIDAKPLGKFKFPKPDDPEDEEINSYDALRDKVEDVFETSFFSGNDIKVYSTEREYVEEYAPLGVVLRQAYYEETRHEINNDTNISSITSRISVHKDLLDMSHSTVEGLLYAMKEDILSQYGDVVDLDDFIGYLYSSEFEAWIEDAASPAKRLKKELGETDSAGS